MLFMGILRFNATRYDGNCAIQCEIKDKIGATCVYLWIGTSPLHHFILISVGINEVFENIM